jgi:O-antigen/teichoic acid export membrane protein
MFAILFSSSAAGFYVLAHRVLATPISVIGGAVASVFFSKAAEAHRENKLSELIYNVLDKLICLAMPATLFLIITAPDLFSFIFGEEWRVAGQYAQWMAPWLCVQFCYSPISTTFEAIEKQRLGLILQIVLFISRVGSLIYGYHYLDLMGTVILYSMLSTLIYLIFLFVILSNMRISMLRVYKNFITISIKAVVCCIPFYLIYKSDDIISIISLFSLGTIFLLVYYYRFFISIKLVES